MNAWDQVRAAITEGRRAQQAVNDNAGDVADLLVGNLRHVSGYTLERLKRELRRYNIHTGRWAK